MAAWKRLGTVVGKDIVRRWNVKWLLNIWIALILLHWPSIPTAEFLIVLCHVEMLCLDPSWSLQTYAISIYFIEVCLSLIWMPLSNYPLFFIHIGFYVSFGDCPTIERDWPHLFIFFRDAICPTVTPTFCVYIRERLVNWSLPMFPAVKTRATLWSLTWIILYIIICLKPSHYFSRSNFG